MTNWPQGLNTSVPNLVWVDDIMAIKSEFDKLVDVGVELDPKIRSLALQQNAVIISFVAPFIPRRVSPVHFQRAEIYIAEEFGMEKIINELKKKGVNLQKLILLVHSPGGAVTSSYKIAKLLRKNFTDITIVVPHVATSGGTLIALSGNRIIMGDMSHLGPLDTQLQYDDVQVSAKSIGASVRTLANFFKDKQVDEAPYPFKAMADRLDPIIVEEWAAALRITHEYATTLVSNSIGSNNNALPDGAPKKTDTEIFKEADMIAGKLVYGFETHGDVIDYEKASELGLTIIHSSKVPELWDCLSDWFHNYVLKASGIHHIRYAIPIDVPEGISGENQSAQLINQEIVQEGKGGDDDD